MTVPARSHEACPRGSRSRPPRDRTATMRVADRSAACPACAPARSRTSARGSTSARRYASSPAATAATASSRPSPGATCTTRDHTCRATPRPRPAPDSTDPSGSVNANPAAGPASTTSVDAASAGITSVGPGPAPVMAAGAACSADATGPGSPIPHPSVTSAPPLTSSTSSTVVGAVGVVDREDEFGGLVVKRPSARCPRGIGRVVEQAGEHVLSENRPPGRRLALGVPETLNVLRLPEVHGLAATGFAGRPVRRGGRRCGPATDELALRVGREMTLGVAGALGGERLPGPVAVALPGERRWPRRALRRHQPSRHRRHPRRRRFTDSAPTDRPATPDMKQRRRGTQQALKTIQGVHTQVLDSISRPAYPWTSDDRPYSRESPPDHPRRATRNPDAGTRQLRGNEPRTQGAGVTHPRRRPTPRTPPASRAANHPRPVDR